MLAQADQEESFSFMSLLENWPDLAMNLVLAIAIFIIGRMITGWITSWMGSILERSGKDPILVDFVTGILKTLLTLVVIVAALNQVGIQTTPLVALIGAAGLAIGMALQDSLKNFASGVLLVLFRPFQTGDFVEAGGVDGVVEEINIFSSTFRTGDNKEVIVPNGEIYSGTITNYSARDTRRVDMVFGIGYDDDIKKAKELLEKWLKEDGRVLEDPAPLVAVGELADSSVNFVVRPWVNTEHYWPFKFDYTERVKLGFDEAGISIPYPQMDVHTKQA